jgi:hypothetical protein
MSDRPFCREPGAPFPHHTVARASVIEAGSRPVCADWTSAAREALRGHGVFAALGKNLFDLGVRAGDDVY